MPLLARPLRAAHGVAAPLRPPYRALLWRLMAGTLLSASSGLSLAADTAWPPALSNAARQAVVPPEAVSMLVLPVQGGPERLAIHADTSRSVASVMKLFTTGTALQTLGPAYTWKTEIGLGGPLTTSGVLKGPVYIKGSGDPALVLERVQLLLARWRAAGLHDIRGDIVLDRSVFQVPEYNAAAFDGQALKPYNAGPDALLLNHRALTLRLRPDDARPKQVRISMEPPLRDMQLLNRTLLTNSPVCGDWREALTLSLAPKPAATTGRRTWIIEVKGPYPRACQEKDWPLLWTGDDDNDYADRLITSTWAQLGGHLGGQVRSGDWPTDQASWMSWVSPPLASVVYDINKFSNNVMARQLFLSLAADPGPATLERARAIVSQHVQTQTRDSSGHSPCDADGLVLDNGSGLSRQERTTPRCMGQWLRALWASPVMPELLGSLPIAGLDGTAKRLNGAAGKVHVKTGSLDGVAALAGVADGESGQRYVVVGVVNGPAAETARPLLDALLSWAVHDRAP
ncbi:MAG: D-alanyl-D-alanine carboxypeptidase/D-alanyl-D-alanine-endopeptidase [Burkholderiales bacterium]|nr:D-alanyl-D-alanine carboxypeptidase/D-alanyl-D-alanine-endopeptidase [Burkholderiales bacterium]